MKGKIVVYAGPMFSEKSAELITAYGRAQLAHRSVLAFKPKMDDRFGQDVIRSRKIGEIPAINITNIEELKESGVTVIVLLAIADGGKPYYDEQSASRIAALGVPCFACTPQMLPELLERALKKQDLSGFDRKN